MKLFPCPVCKHQISDSAVSCPHCGHPVNGPQSARIIDSNVAGKAVTAVAVWAAVPWIARIVAVIVVGIVAIFMFKGS